MSEGDANDQSFNDQELQDIMSEIESLENEGDEAAAEAPKAETSEAPEAAAQEEAETSNSPENVVQLRESTASVGKASTASVGKASTADGTAMSLNVSGDLNLGLNFQIGDQTVTIKVDGSQGLAIQLDSGVCFTVPLQNLSAGKKAV